MMKKWTFLLILLMTLSSLAWAGSVLVTGRIVIIGPEPFSEKTVKAITGDLYRPNAQTKHLLAEAQNGDFVSITGVIMKTALPPLFPNIIHIEQVYIRNDQ